MEAGDDALLCRVYGSTRSEELALTDWDDEQKDAFVRMQFDAQTAWWAERYTEVSYDVVLVGGEPAGRLYVARWREEIRIVDIALLPEYRGRGVGTALLRSVLEEGRASAKPVTIHVERFNRALTLYRRLGFEVAEDKGVYLLLRRQPHVKTAS